MATFTMELWEVLELNHDPGFTDPTSDAAGGTIGLGQYPIFAENHRQVLNEKIIERYWNREIGMETISMFRLAMKRRMNEIMVFYNQLYNSELIQFSPLDTFKLTTTRNGVETPNLRQTTNSHTTNDSTSVSRSQASDTPQNELPDGWEENADYATSGAASQAKTDGTADNVNTNVTSGTNATQDVSTTTGFQGSAANLLTAFRSTILGIDAAILSDLNQLFMGVWDNGQEMLFPYPYAIRIIDQGM